MGAAIYGLAWPELLVRELAGKLLRGILKSSWMNSSTAMHSEYFAGVEARLATRRVAMLARVVKACIHMFCRTALTVNGRSIMRFAQMVGNT